MKTIAIICLLGDPLLPAVSVPNSGGYNVDSLELLEFMLTQKDWNCVFITNKSDYMTEDKQIIGDNITIYRVLIPDIYIKNQNLISEYYPKIFESIEDILDLHNSRIDLVHSFYWLSGKVAYDINKKYNIPYVHSAVSLSLDKLSCGEAPNCYFQFEWEKKFLKSAKYVMTITDAEQRSLTKKYGINPMKVVIVGRGVHKAFEYPIRTPDGIPSQLTNTVVNISQPVTNADFWNNGVFLYMGRLKRIKGIYYIVKAWYNLYMDYKENTPPLWIVGGTPNEIEDVRNQIKKFVSELQQLESTQKVVWWGYLNPEGISTLLLKTLVLVCHSKFEAGGRIIIEAMSSGTPIISTPTGFGADYIYDWCNGFLVPYADESLLTHRMRHFVIQPLLSNSLGNIATQAYQRIKTRFNCYDKHITLYNNVISRNSNKISFENENCILSQIKAEVSASRLTTYPYGKVMDDTNYIKKIIEINFNICCDSIVKIKQGIWVVDFAEKKLVVKKLTSKLNMQTLWCPSDNPVAFTPETQLDKIVNICSKYTPCFRIREYCDVNSIIVAEYCTKLSTLPDFETMLDCISKQEKITNVNDYKHLILTRQSVLGKLCSAANMKVSPLWRKIWDKIRQQFESSLRLDKPTADYGWCYGKSYIEHVVQYNGTIYLLPTETVFPAEWGYDFAELLTEYYLKLNWNIIDYMKSYDITLAKVGLTSEVFLPVCLCSASMCLLKKSVLQYSADARLLNLIDYLINFKILP